MNDTSGSTPTGGGSSKFKSKFASGASSKFLSKTPTNQTESGSTSFDGFDNNNNESKNNDNNNNNGIIETSSMGLSSINSLTRPLSYQSSTGGKDNGIANTDFNESDGRDVNILGTTHQLPLQYRWTLWHTAPKTKQQGWTDNYKQIASFDTVGTFWQLFNNIAPPSMLHPGSSYHLFKGKVEPMWEDKFNKGGGSWTYRFGDVGGNNKGGRGKGRDRDRRNRHDRRDRDRDRNNEEGSNIINYAWYYTVLNMIGNNINYSENICGVVISIRKGGRSKIELWIRNADDRQSTRNIGYEFGKFSGARDRNISINFITHEDNKNGSRKKIDINWANHDKDRLG